MDGDREGDACLLASSVGAGGGTSAVFWERRVRHDSHLAEKQNKAKNVKPERQT